MRIDTLEELCKTADALYNRAVTFILFNAHLLRKTRRVSKSEMRSVLASRWPVKGHIGAYAFVSAWEVLRNKEGLI